MPAIMFCGCAFTRAAEGHRQGQTRPRRREVTIGGRRVRTIDIHAHCEVPEAHAVLGRRMDSRDLLMSDTSARLADMDAQGIDMEALSINPWWYATAPDAAAEIIRIQNEALAAIRDANPQRFTAFATAALQHPELAAAQLEHAVKKLGFRGVGVGGSVEGLELADPKFNPFWAKCEELGALVFLHPQGTRELEASGRLRGNGLLSNTIGNPLETTIALSHLIFEGTLDRYPGLRICAAHGGGYLPSYANRSDAVIRTFPHRVGPPTQNPPTSYLRNGQLFFDTIVFTPEALRHLIAEVGAEHVVMGTDYPFPWTSTEVDLVMNTPDLTDQQRTAILGGTAGRLLGLA